MNSLITIIIPIYNVEKYLKACLTSVHQQTYQNLEVLLIDDGSSDHSVKICEYFVKFDSRFRLIQQKNQGQSVARNHGIEQATGAYIIFVDADDTLSPTHVATLYQGLSQFEGAQVAMCRPTRDPSKIESNHQPTTTCISGTYRELLENEDHSFARMGCWCKIYEKSVIENLRFPVGILHQDNVFFYEMLDKIDQLVLVHSTTYYYRRRHHSAVQGEIRPKNFDLFKRNALLYEWFQNHHPECMDYILADCLRTNDGYARKAIKEKTNIAQEFFDQIVKENRQYGRGRWAQNHTLYLAFLTIQKYRVKLRKFWRLLIKK